MEKHSWAWVSPVKEEEGGRSVSAQDWCLWAQFWERARLHQTGLGGREPGCGLRRRQLHKEGQGN